MSCIPCQSKNKIPWGKTIANGVKAAPRIARQVIFNKYVGISEKSERMQICFKCPNYQPKDQRCILCTCFLDKKTIFSDETCPIGKW